MDAAQLKDPMDRLSKVMAFAMTSSESEEFNKKPYNPILGEELTCWSEHTDGSRSFFRGEQVSHHPPMSAFYVYNDKHDVSFQCNVEFAVTFHGNSVTIATKGFGEISIGDEVYVISKYIPDLKVESVVFGSRRQAWKGEWEITCAKTNVGAVLNFSETKKSTGWLGGGAFTNEVAGFMFHLTDESRSPIATFSGLAGERIMLQKNRSSREESILDFRYLESQEIKFIPRNMAPPNDSLRVWHKVTEFVLKDDMKSADLAKVRVEDNARKLRKQRETTGEEHVPKYFSREGEKWVHNEKAKATEVAQMASTATNVTQDDTLSATRGDFSESVTRTEYSEDD